MSWDPESLLEDRAWMAGLARRLVGEGAEDLVQDAALIALESSRAPERPWLGGVLRHLSARRWRGEAHRRQREEAVARPESQTDGATGLERLEVQGVVAEELHGLDEPYRSTLVLRYFEGLSASEIAGRQAVAIGTVNSRLSRGADRMRARLERRLGSEAWMAALMPLAPNLPVKAGLPWLKIAGAAALLACCGTVWRALERPSEDVQPVATGLAELVKAEPGGRAPQFAPAPDRTGERAANRGGFARGQPREVLPSGARVPVQVDLLAQGRFGDDWMPLPGANVEFGLRWPGDAHWSVERVGTTGSAGRLSFALEPMLGLSPLSWDHVDQRIISRHDKLGTGWGEIDLNSDWPQATALALVRSDRKGVLARLVDRSGAPVAGATVLLSIELIREPDDPGEISTKLDRRSTGSAQFVTGTDGRFAVGPQFLRRIDGESGRVAHWVHVKGRMRARVDYAGIRRTLPLSHEGPAEDLVWDRGLTLRGLVKTEAGEPVPGIAVTLGLHSKRYRNNRGEYIHPRTWEGWTGDDGRWSASGLDPGLYLVMLLNAEGGQETLASLPGQRVDMVLTEPLLRVQALDRDRLPVRGFSFDLHQEVEGMVSAYTMGPTGTATFFVVAGKTYTLRYPFGPERTQREESVVIPSTPGVTHRSIVVETRSFSKLQLRLDGQATREPVGLRVLEAYGSRQDLTSVEALRSGSQVLHGLPAWEYLVQPLLDPRDGAAGLVPDRSLVTVDPERKVRPAADLRILRGGPVELVLQPPTTDSQVSRQGYEVAPRPAFRAGREFALRVVALRKGRGPIELHPVVRTKDEWGDLTPYPGEFWLPGAPEVSVENLDEGDWTLRVEGKHWQAAEELIEIVAGRATSVRVAITPQ